MPHVDHATQTSPAGNPSRGGGPATRSSAESNAQPYVGNLEQLARANRDFRRVIFTGSKTQLVLMSIPPGGEIGQEMHPRVEQVFVVVNGTGNVEMNGSTSTVGPGSVIVATPGTHHNVIATGNEPLKLYTIYSPPNHIDGRVHASKADADRDREDEAFGRSVR